MAAVGLRRDCGLRGVGRLAEALEEYYSLMTLTPGRESSAVSIRPTFCQGAGSYI